MSEQPAEPEVWLTMDDWAQRCGFSEASGRRTVASWLQRRWPRNNPIPPPDEVVVEKGHARPRWRESTFEAWAARRPGRSRTDGRESP